MLFVGITQQSAIKLKCLVVCKRRDKYTEPTRPPKQAGEVSVSATARKLHGSTCEHPESELNYGQGLNSSRHPFASL